MAIHERYANAIMDGVKRVEFRKRGLADDIQIVWVYATAPMSKVIGRFSVDEIVQGTPQDIWERFGADGIIEQDDFFDYFDGRERAVAIVVGSAQRLPTPISLGEIDPRPAVPQSFAYLSASAAPVLAIA